MEFKYCLDLDEITNFINYDEDTEQVKFTEEYVPDEIDKNKFHLVKREKESVKNITNETKVVIRNDLVNRLLDSLQNYTMDSEADAELRTFEDSVLFNTMVKYNFLKKID